MDATPFLFRPVVTGRVAALTALAAVSWLAGCAPEALPALGPAESAASLTHTQGSEAQRPSKEWASWNRFARRFVTPEGRVVDRTFGGKTTSEGQSYGLFFALVAGDRQVFERIRRWTDDELAAGKLGEQLPGWLWALQDDGSWGLKDRNAAADADLWIAYSLLEAGRLWDEPRYRTQGRTLLASIAAREVVELDDGRALLLPAPYGFNLGDGRYRFNPSYLPGFMLLAFSHEDPGGPWVRLWNTYLELAPLMFPAGVAPDLCIVDRRGRVFRDRERGAVGSYDAIRVYLWAGMSPPGEANLLPHLRGMLPLLSEHGVPPEKLDASTGNATATDYSPHGFQGAVLPYLAALGEPALLARQLRRVRVHGLAAQSGASTHYYDEALILFGAGWQEGWYRFDAAGHLVLPQGR